MELVTGERLDRHVFADVREIAAVGLQAARALLESLAYDCRSGEVDVRGDVREFIAREMSRHSALPYGRELTGEEMADIYTRLMTSGDRQKTPDGRKTIAIITDDSLDAMF